MKQLIISNIQTKKLIQRIPENARLIAGAVFTGILAGIITTLLKKGIALVSNSLTEKLDPLSASIWFLVLPIVAILSGYLWQRIVKQNLAHSTDQLQQRATSNNYNFKISQIFTPIIGCMLTIGCGASAGAEGPSAFSGAAGGNWAARVLKLSPDNVAILFGAGAAAGIAGIFKAPIGGILFTFEILGMGFSAVGFAAIVTAALTAFVTAFILSGFAWNLTLDIRQVFDLSQLWWIILMGVACGAYCIYYRHTNKLASSYLSRIRNRWLAALICGLMLGVSILLFPMLFGEGYTIVSDLANGKHISLIEYTFFYNLADNSPQRSNLIVMLAIASVLAIKGFAVGATNSGGGVAGEFAPTLFAGALAGALFAMIMNLLGIHLQTDSFALIGAAAVMAGAVRAPLMAIFIGAEISDRYELILPFILACAGSYIVVYLHDSLSKKLNSQTTT